MVLSNKKRKQQLRAAKADSGAAPPVDNGGGIRAAQIESTELKQSGEAQSSILGKRKKARKAAEDGGGGTKVETGVESARSKKRKTKIEGAGVVDLLGNVVKLKSEKQKKQWKKKKKNKSGKKKEKAGSEVNENGQRRLITELDLANASGESEATNKVYVGGIPYYSSEDDIHSFFESCGTISELDCMSFPESGKFRGIAIITFKTEAAAKRALALDGADMGGLFLKIQPYRAARSQPKPADFSPKIIEGYNRIYVGNLSWEVTEEDLRNFFCDCSITSIRFGMDKETEEFKGYAHVDFSDNDSLLIALSLDQKVVCGRPARIRSAVPLKGTKTQVGTSNDLLEKEDGKSSSNQKKKRRTCYQCGIPGHLSSSCPNKPETSTLPVQDE